MRDDTDSLGLPEQPLDAFSWIPFLSFSFSINYYAHNSEGCSTS